ncbi:MAG: STAS domain-containing protein [bacterium]
MTRETLVIMSYERFNMPGTETLSIKVERRDNAVVLLMSGSVDIQGSNRMSEVVDMEIARGNLNIIMDFKGVMYMDSTGIGVLVSKLNRIKGGGGRLIIIGINDEIRELLKIVRLEKIFEMYDNLNGALDALR